MSPQRRRKMLPLLTLAIAAGPALAGTPNIIPLTSNLLPDHPHQPIQFMITGADLIAGADLNFQVNAGAAGPTLTSVDLLTNTIFAANNTGQTHLNAGPYTNWSQWVSTTTSSGTILDHGLLATLYINTAGLNSGTFQINLLGTLNGSSDLVLPNASTLTPFYPHNLFTIGNTDRHWVHNTGGTWSLDSNWSPFAPYTAGDPANFLSAITSGTATITLDGDRTAGSLTFNNASASYLIAQGAGGTLQLNSAAPTITDTAGNHTISAPLALTADTTITITRPGDTLTLAGPISGPGGLTIAGSGLVLLANPAVFAGPLTVSGTCRIAPNATITGRTRKLTALNLIGSGLLDLTNNNLIITSGAGITSQIRQAANLGAWNGAAGITSSAAAAAATTSTATALAYTTGAEYSAATGNTLFDSLPFAPADTLIKYTLAGDANMDGSVTFADFLALQNHYNQPGDWTQGDWNYDGQVTFADFLVLQNNYNKILAAASMVPFTPTAAPEPATLAAISAALLLLMRRRSSRIPR